MFILSSLIKFLNEICNISKKTGLELKRDLAVLAHARGVFTQPRAAPQIYSRDRVINLQDI